jgi:hypothetical protein
MAPPTTFWEDARKALEADGWEYDVDGDRMVPAVPGVILAEQTSLLE